MFVTLKQFFDKHLQPANTEGAKTQQLELACAALLIEIATIDGNFSDEEYAVLIKQLQTRYPSLSDPEIRELEALARQEHSDATSLYQFTRLIHEHFSYQDKCELLKSMWLIARADAHIDKYEEYMIRRISELLYISHSDFIRAKVLSLQAWEAERR